MDNHKHEHIVEGNENYETTEEGERVVWQNKKGPIDKTRSPARKRTKQNTELTR